MSYSEFAEPTFGYAIVTEQTGMLVADGMGRAYLFHEEEQAKAYWARLAIPDTIVSVLAVVPVNPDAPDGEGDDLDDLLAGGSPDA